MDIPPAWIVHLCSLKDWEAAQVQGEFRASSLETEGFMHASRPEQIAGVANRFYSGQRGQVLLWIDPRRLQSVLRWESADDQVFPHLYGPLNLDAIRTVTSYEPGEDGSFSPPAIPSFLPSL